MTRRQVLRLFAIAGATAAARPRLLAGVVPPPAPASPAGFLSAGELRILDAVTELILPTDDLPGAREIGVVGYIQSLLTFLPGSDANCDRHVNVADLSAVEAKVLGQFLGCPEGGDVNGDGAVDLADARAAESAAFRARPMFGGGPFSGRNPQPHFPIGGTPCSVCHGVDGVDARTLGSGAGAPTIDVVPPATFGEFLPMNRLQKLSWRVRILGGDAVPEVADNPLLAELPDVDLRRRYREGLASLESIAGEEFGKGFLDLTRAERQQVLDRVSGRFVELLQRHVIEGTVCPPEYGGNHNQLGWKLTGFDGDSQPLGYEIYDESMPGNYRERPDKPNSGPNPDEDCRGFSPKMQEFLGLLSTITGGGTFAEPYCFEVDG